MSLRDENEFGVIQSRLVQIGMVCVLLGLVLVSIKYMMIGISVRSLFVVVFVMLGAALLLLDRLYWVIPVFLFGFQHVIPMLKFEGFELGAILLIGMFFFRAALHRDKLTSRHSLLWLIALPFLLWMCIVWSMHPTGLLIFGGRTIGGRYYMKVILSFLSMIVSSMMILREREARLFFWFYAAGIVANVCCHFIGLEEDGLSSVSQMDQTHYGFIQMSFLTSLLLCRYSIPYACTHFFPFIALLVSGLLTLYAGNRTAFGRVALFALLTPFAMRRKRFASVVVFFVMGLALAFAIAGHGNLYRLPFSFQRCFSFLPGKWDPRLERYGFNDEFRTEMRRLARLEIHENPWTGLGGFSLDLQTLSFAGSSFHSDNFASMAYARNWHNVWLGMAADFGIPLSVAWGFFTFCSLRFIFFRLRRIPPDSWVGVLFAYFALLQIVGFVNTFFDGGHASRTPQEIFIYFGLMVFALNGIEAESESRSIPQDSQASQPQGKALPR